MRTAIMRLFWCEALIAAVALAMLVLTALWPRWIELAFGFDPDGGSGSVEWIIAGVCCVLAVACSALARYSWRLRRLSGAPSAA